MIPVLDQTRLRKGRALVTKSLKVSGIKVLRQADRLRIPGRIGFWRAGVAMFHPKAAGIQIQQLEQPLKFLIEMFQLATNDAIGQRIWQRIEPMAGRTKMRDTVCNRRQPLTTFRQVRGPLLEKVLMGRVLREDALSALVESTSKKISVAAFQARQGVTHHHERHVVMSKRGRIQRAATHPLTIAEAQQAAVMDAVEITKDSC